MKPPPLTEIEKKGEKDLASGHNSDAVEAAKHLGRAIRKAIDDEPEYPGDMPDEMFNAIKNDRDAITEAMRLTTRLVKDGIRIRVREVIERGSGSPRDAAPSDTPSPTKEDTDWQQWTTSISSGVVNQETGLAPCAHCGGEGDTSNWKPLYGLSGRNLSVFCENVGYCGAEITERHVPENRTEEIMKSLVVRWNKRAPLTSSASAQPVESALSPEAKSESVRESKDTA